MLRYLRINNFAIIDEIEVEFQEGFNVLTGETGAGKSILIGALGLGRCAQFPERGVDFRSNAAGGQRGQPRLGSAASDGVADLEPPSPDIWLGSSRDTVLDASVFHSSPHRPLFGNTFAALINPGEYGTRSAARLDAVASSRHRRRRARRATRQL